MMKLARTRVPSFSLKAITWVIVPPTMATVSFTKSAVPVRSSVQSVGALRTPLRYCFMTGMPRARRVNPSGKGICPVNRICATTPTGSVMNGVATGLNFANPLRPC